MHTYSNDCQWQCRGRMQPRCWELSSLQHTSTLFSNLNVFYMCYYYYCYYYLCGLIPVLIIHTIEINLSTINLNVSVYYLY